MKLRHLFALSVIAATMAVAAGTASAQTITYRAGPFHVGGFETKLPKLQVRAPHMDGYITKMNATLHYANGRRVSIRKVMLHHIVFLNDGRRTTSRAARARAARASRSSAPARSASSCCSRPATATAFAPATAGGCRRC